jgi:hypothetical protein
VSTAELRVTVITSTSGGGGDVAAAGFFWLSPASQPESSMGTKMTAQTALQADKKTSCFIYISSKPFASI